MHEPINFHTTQAILFKKFHAHNTWTFLIQFIQTGTNFNSPKIEQWAVCGQPTHQTSVSLCGTEFHGHLQPHTHQNTIYCINYTTSRPNSLWTVQNGSKNSNNSIPSFGTDQTVVQGLKPTKSLTKHLNRK